MRMVASPTYLYGLAAAVYVTTCLVVAAVRWFHMCRPLSEAIDAAGFGSRPTYYSVKSKLGPGQ